MMMILKIVIIIMIDDNSNNDDAADGDIYICMYAYCCCFLHFVQLGSCHETGIKIPIWNVIGNADVGTK